MSLYVPALIVGLAGVASLALLWARGLRREVAFLTREREERRRALARTSKLLIDKNMELFDQNLRQQQEIENKEDFISIVSHQLRTPATEVKWGLDALGSEMERQHRHGRERDYFEKLEKSAEHMVRLIDSLVRLMSLDEQFLRPATMPYEPDPTIRATAEELARHFADKHINLTLVLEASGEIDSIDPDSLKLVVDNLIENAYEYTPEGGRVTVTTARNLDGSVVCTVSDTGVGIPKEKIPAIFTKFQRSEAAVQMNAGGMGLGLYLVKNVVERHGGIVSFESEEGKGSTFRFALPATRRA